MTAETWTTLLVGVLSATVALVAATLTQRRANQERVDAVSRAERERDAALERLDRQLEAQARDTATKEARSDERHRLNLAQARTRLMTERFGRAAEQMGTSESAVRLAGVYAMASLADEWEEQRQQCVDVLCAYLRLPWSGTEGEPEVRATAVRTIHEHTAFDRDVPGEVKPWSSLHFDFRGATFPAECDLGCARFRSADFGSATFQGKASFGAVVFDGRADFSDSRFAGQTDFASAVFSREAVFDGAHFVGSACFGKAEFNHEGWYPAAQFNAARFDAPVSFSDATFASKVEFVRAQFAGEVDFENAMVNGWLGFLEAGFDEDVSFEGASGDGNLVMEHIRVSSDGSPTIRLPDGREMAQPPKRLEEALPSPTVKARRPGLDPRRSDWTSESGGDRRDEWDGDPNWGDGVTWGRGTPERSDDHGAADDEPAE